jgi:hypothetical protein
MTTFSGLVCWQSGPHHYGNPRTPAYVGMIGISLRRQKNTSGYYVVRYGTIPTVELPEHQVKLAEQGVDQDRTKDARP